MASTVSGGTRRTSASPGLPRLPVLLTDAVLRLRLLAPLASANRGWIPLERLRAAGGPGG